MTPFTDNTGKVLTRQVRDANATALTLNYSPKEATALRSFVASIKLRGDKTPSMSLIARRAMTVYLAHVQYSHETKASEIAVLEKLATNFSDRAPCKPTVAA